MYVPFIQAFILHIKRRLPDTEIFAAFSTLDPGKLPSSSEEAVSKNYGEAHVDTLEKHYGQGDGAIVDSVTIKGELFELRPYLCMHNRSLSMLNLLTMDNSQSCVPKILSSWPKYV